MSGDFVESVHIQNFGCVRDTTIELTPLHALIGPNDSGKSTVLAALRIAGQIGQRHGDDARENNATEITIAPGAHEVVVRKGPAKWEYTTRDHRTPLPRAARLVRWDPDSIRRPAELISDEDFIWVGEDGSGIPAVYEALLSRDRDAFAQIESDVRRHFPTVKDLWLPTSTDKKKVLGAILTDGTRVHAATMSEGLLYWLAFAILPHVKETGMLLVEEPENGLHPSRIAEVMKVLRKVSARTQVVLATHSPLVINEMKPEEVTILTRTANEGTRATRIDRTKHFQSREKVYALGELWLSFADGNSEEALVSPG